MNVPTAFLDRKEQYAEVPWESSFGGFMGLGDQANPAANFVFLLRLTKAEIQRMVPDRMAALNFNERKQKTK